MKEVVKNNIINISSLAIGYTSKKGKNVVASDVNVSLQKGNLVCLLGKNGIGKSTLLRTIAKVQPILNGTIKINDELLENISSTALSQIIGLVLTERIPENNLTVYELITLGRQPYTNWLGTITNEDKEYINAAIKSTNIEDLTSKKCHELSDGQLQKVMIARVLAQNTDLIILDEPTAHLDIHHKIEVFNLLKKLVKEFDKTVIISTHEVQLALQLADALWLMNDNSFVSGPTEKLIPDNQLDNLFDSKLVKFDLKTRQFIVNT